MLCLNINSVCHVYSFFGYLVIQSKVKEYQLKASVSRSIISSAQLGQLTISSVFEFNNQFKAFNTFSTSLKVFTTCWYRITLKKPRACTKEDANVNKTFYSTFILLLLNYCWYRTTKNLRVGCKMGLNVNKTFYSTVIEPVVDNVPL